MPAHRPALVAGTQGDELWRARPAPAPEEAHPFIQQVFLILPQMGNSSHGRPLMYETRMFSVTSYIPLFIPSVNNKLLSSLDVLHWATCLYSRVPAVSRGVFPAWEEGEGASCWRNDYCPLLSEESRGEAAQRAETHLPLQELTLLPPSALGVLFHNSLLLLLPHLPFLKKEFIH